MQENQRVRKLTSAKATGDSMSSSLEYITDEFEKMELQIAKLKQQRDELRSYARHKIYCPKGIAGAPYPCNCGFEQAIAKAGA